MAQLSTYIIDKCSQKASIGRTKYAQVTNLTINILPARTTPCIMHLIAHHTMSTARHTTLSRFTLFNKKYFSYKDIIEYVMDRYHCKYPASSSYSSCSMGCCFFSALYICMSSIRLRRKKPSCKRNFKKLWFMFFAIILNLMHTKQEKHIWINDPSPHERQKANRPKCLLLRGDLFRRTESSCYACSIVEFLSY